MLAILAFIAFVIGAVLAFTGTGHLIVIVGVIAAGLALLALHLAWPVVVNRQPQP